MNTASSSTLKSWIAENRSRFSGEVLFDEPLSKHTYYRIGGPVHVLVVPLNLADLQWVRACIAATGTPFTVLGAGSNVLAADSGFAGLVIKTTRLQQTMVCESPSHLVLGASVAVSSLLKRAGTEGWGGLELLAGIPGTIGGVIRMNAGTHLGEAKDRVIRVETFDLTAGDGDLRSHLVGPQNFAYRHNLFLGPSELVVSSTWSIEKREPAGVKAEIDAVLHRRKETQPLNKPSCGSVFKNPKESGVSAWQVVDRLGLRGHRIGDAQISEKHSNFIVNLGNARAADVAALIKLVRTRARAELGIEMVPEVLPLGDVELGA